MAMTDESTPDSNPTDGPPSNPRLDALRVRHMQIFDFLYYGRKSGRVTSEGLAACSQTLERISAAAGIGSFTKLKPEEVDPAVVCGIVAHAQHQAIVALLEVQPELREEFEKSVPPLPGGPSR